jgi:hypothetical protein
MVEGLPSELVAKLLLAGFQAEEVVGTRAGLVPVLVARYVTQLGVEDGRRDFLVSHDEPDLRSKLNAEWEGVAVDCGLFSAGNRNQREFLIGLDVSAEALDELETTSYRWVRVGFSEDWDMAGVGCETGLFGAGPNNPTFVVTSLTGDVVMVAGYWQSGIGFAVARSPGKILKLQEHARRIASYAHIEAEQRYWARRWLSALGGDAE